MRGTTLLLAVALALPSSLTAQDDVILSAMSAGPLSISYAASVMTWGDWTVVREGSNGWTCLPDRSDTPGNDPWCVDETWLGFIHALFSGTEPNYTTFGTAYMLMGDTEVSNTDPAATEKTTDADWVEGLGAHLMMLVPDKNALRNISTDPYNGGPWVMWPDTPYAHVMIPIASYSR